MLKEGIMNTRKLRKIIGLILAALLLTSIGLLASATAAAQRRYQRRGYQRQVVSVQSIDRFEPMREAQPVRPFHTFGPFGRSYHPFFDPYGRYDSYTFYRHSIGRSHR
jgi:hypothetical protein